MAEESGRGPSPRSSGARDPRSRRAAQARLEAGVEPGVADELDDEIRAVVVRRDEEQQDLLRAVRAGVEQRPAMVVDVQARGRRGGSDIGRWSVDGSGRRRWAKCARLGREIRRRTPSQPPDDPAEPGADLEIVGPACGHEPDQRPVRGRHDRTDLSTAQAEPQHVVIGHAGRQCRLRRPSGRPARAEPDEQAAAGGQDALDLGGDIRVRRHPLGPGLVDRRDEIDAAVGHRPWRPAGLVGHDHQAVPRDLGERGRRGVGRPAEREDRPQVASRQRIAPDCSAGRVAGVLSRTEVRQRGDPDRGPAGRRCSGRIDVSRRLVPRASRR